MFCCNVCEDFLGRGKENLCKWFWSHDQDGRHAHIWLKTPLKPSSPEQGQILLL